LALSIHRSRSAGSNLVYLPNLIKGMAFFRAWVSSQVAGTPSISPGANALTGEFQLVAWTPCRVKTPSAKVEAVIDHKRVSDSGCVETLSKHRLTSYTLFGTFPVRLAAGCCLDGRR
jgi:hypothetical protein